MEGSYLINLKDNILKVSFGPRSAQNDEICRDALKRLMEMKKT